MRPLLRYADFEDQIPAPHLLRKIAAVANDALTRLDEDFNAAYTDCRRPSMAQERLIQARRLCCTILPIPGFMFLSQRVTLTL